MIDHVTYEIPERLINNQALSDFFDLLEMEEIEAEEDPGWTVRWYRPIDGDQTTIHLTASFRWSDPELGLAHFAVRVGGEAYSLCRKSQWCTRDAGSGRIWMRGPGGLRVEVRPK